MEGIIIKDGKTGKALAKTTPGARIYSIKDTKKLISLSAKARDRQSTIDLGRAMLEMTMAQDQKPVQYTD